MTVCFIRKKLRVIQAEIALGSFRESSVCWRRGTISVKEWVTNQLSLSEVPENFSKLSKYPGLIKRSSIFLKVQARIDHALQVPRLDLGIIVGYVAAILSVA